jgi:hypothetical protein
MRRPISEWAGKPDLRKFDRNQDEEEGSAASTAAPRSGMSQAAHIEPQSPSLY